MGQQQLLLVILVTIIVGIATIVAITTFRASADEANKDAVRQDMVALGTSMQSYIMKPAGLGGGDGDFTNMTFFEIPVAADSISPNGLVAFNANGTYTLSSLSSSAVCLVAVPSSDATEELHVDIYDSDLLWYDTH